MTTFGGRQPSLPPSDPHGLGRSVIDLPGQRDHSVRVRLGAALVAAFVAVGIGLFLWRRPHAPSQPTADEAQSSSAMAASEPPPEARQPQLVAPPPPVAVSEARVLGCHDRGPRVTAPDQCDHLPTIEKALVAAIEQAASCVPSSGGPGSPSSAGSAGGATAATIEYVVELSFNRSRLTVTLPHEGRSVRDRKVVRACGSAVRAGLQLAQFTGVPHEHAQYKIAVTATYRPGADGGI
jgi:hypothetical protein